MRANYVSSSVSFRGIVWGLSFMPTALVANKTDSGGSPDDRDVDVDHMVDSKGSTATAISTFVDIRQGEMVESPYANHTVTRLTERPPSGIILAETA
jgi:hypothetical protein